MLTLSINGKSYEVDVEPETPLLWVLRDTIGLTGTKYGCGIAQCGACTVHIDGQAVRSCQMPVGALNGRHVTTIEALAQNGSLHPVQKAWIEFGDRRGNHKYLPLRDLSASAQGDPRGRRSVTREV